QPPTPTCAVGRPDGNAAARSSVVRPERAKTSVRLWRPLPDFGRIAAAVRAGQGAEGRSRGAGRHQPRRSHGPIDLTIHLASPFAAISFGGLGRAFRAGSRGIDDRRLL